MELAKRVVKMKEEVEHGKTIGRPPTFISFLKKKKKCWGDHEFLLCAHLVSFRFTCGQAISFTSKTTFLHNYFPCPWLNWKGKCEGKLFLLVGNGIFLPLAYIFRFPYFQTVWPGVAIGGFENKERKIRQREGNLTSFIDHRLPLLCAENFPLVVDGRFLRCEISPRHMSRFTGAGIIFGSPVKSCVAWACPTFLCPTLTFLSHTSFFFFFWKKREDVWGKREVGQKKIRAGMGSPKVGGKRWKKKEGSPKDTICKGRRASFLSLSFSSTTSFG